MFNLSFDRRRRIVFIQFTGALDPEAIAELGVIGKTVADAEGGCDWILDFALLSAVRLPVDFLAERAKRPARFPDHWRILVAGDAEIRALSRIYAGHRERNGHRAPTIVASLDEAFVRLGTERAAFEPFEPGRARLALQAVV
jgi:hypothetical protein